MSPEKTFEKKIKKIEKRLASMEGKITKAQSKLLTLIIEGLIVKFDFNNGKLVNSISNINLLNEVDTIFDLFKTATMDDIVKKFAFDMLDMASINVPYFVALGFTKELADKAAINEKELRRVLGLTKKGNIKKGTYLDGLTKLNPLREEIKNYVVGSLLNEDTSLRQFTDGLKDKLGGSKSITKHWATYAFDQYNEINEVQNLAIAEGLGLKHGLYAGGLIATSRPFCKKWNNRVFTISYAKNKWKDDKTHLKTKAEKKAKKLFGYKFTKRGRWGCRHWIRYITRKEYNRRNGKSKAN